MKLKKCHGRESGIIQTRIVLSSDGEIKYIDFDSYSAFRRRKEGMPERFVYCTYCGKRGANEFDFDNLYLHREEKGIKFYRSKVTAEELWNGVENPEGGKVDFVVVDEEDEAYIQFFNSSSAPLSSVSKERHLKKLKKCDY